MTDLDALMREVLLRLELVSHGSTQAWNASGGGSGEPDDKVVSLVARGERPPHVVYRERYERASVSQRQAVYDQAKAELGSWVRRTAPVPENVKTLEEFVLEDGEGHEDVVVAARFNVAVQLVRRLRMRDGRDLEFGRTLLPEAAVDADRASRARELRGQGLSTRQIALILGVSQSAVMNWTRKAS